MITRDIETEASAIAEDLAIKQTGQDFNTLPRQSQLRIWDEAWDEAINTTVASAEYASVACGRKVYG